MCYYTVAAKSRVEHLYWSSPPNWSAYALAEHLDGVLPYGGGTRLDRPMRRSPAWPSRELGPCPKELDGLSCMHQLFPGREPHKLYSVVLEGVCYAKTKQVAVHAGQSRQLVEPPKLSPF